MSAPVSAPVRPVVVKLGGRPQGDPALPAALAALWRATGGALVLVHGGGDQISARQQPQSTHFNGRLCSGWDGGCYPGLTRPARARA